MPTSSARSSPDHGRWGARPKPRAHRLAERASHPRQAKDLGLSLDDIAELLPVWEGEQCAEVAGRPAVLIADKVVETRTRIAELRSFAAELEAAGHRSSHDVADGPCSETCACASTPGPPLDTRIAIAIGTKPKRSPSDEPAPIACTLTAGRAMDRVDEWAQLLSSQIGAPRRQTGGSTTSVTVSFAPDPATAARAAELAAAEQACCAFIDFERSIDREGIALTATTTTEAASIVEALLGVPT